MRLCDCVQMSKLAANLMCDVDDASNSPELFAVVHLHDMLVSLKERYYALWHGEVRPA